MTASPNEVTALVEELDTNNRGFIEYDAFLNSCFISYILLKEYRIRLLFETFDTEKKGVVTVSQLREVLTNEECKFPEDALDRAFKDELKVDLSSIDPATYIDYNQFLESLRKEYRIE